MWEDIIKKDLQEVGWECKEWIVMAGDRGRWLAVVNAGMNLLIP